MFSSPVFYKEVKAQNRQSTTAVFAVHPVCFFATHSQLAGTAGKHTCPCQLRILFHVKHGSLFFVLMFHVKHQNTSHFLQNSLHNLLYRFCNDAIMTVQRFSFHVKRCDF